MKGIRFYRRGKWHGKKKIHETFWINKKDAGRKLESRPKSCLVLLIGDRFIFKRDLKRKHFYFLYFDISRFTRVSHLIFSLSKEPWPWCRKIVDCCKYKLKKEKKGIIEMRVVVNNTEREKQFEVWYYSKMMTYSLVVCKHTHKTFWFKLNKTLPMIRYALLVFQFT